MSTERFPLRDAHGDPLGVDSFVRVVLVSRRDPTLRPKEFRGQVVAIETDEHGPILVVREWRGGDLLHGARACRPEHCTTTSYPARLRARLTDRAARSTQ